MASNSLWMAAVKPFDVYGSVQGAQTTVSRQLELDKQKGLTDLYRTQGAEIARGEQGALDAVARFDPAKSQAFKLGNAQTAAASRENAIAEMGIYAAALEHADTPQKWQAAKPAAIEMARQAGASEATLARLAGTRFEQRDSLRQSVLGLVGTIKDARDKQIFDARMRQARATLANTRAAGARASKSPGDRIAEQIAAIEQNLGRKLTPQERAQFLKVGAPGAKPLSAEGKLAYDRDVLGLDVGAGGDPRQKAFEKATEGERKAFSLLEQAIPAYEDMKKQVSEGFTGLSTADAIKGTALGEWAQSAEGQRYGINVRVLNDAILRLETGAQIADPETARKLASIRFSYWDTPAVVKRKIEQVDAVMRGLTGAAGRLAPYARSQALPAGSGGRTRGGGFDLSTPDGRRQAAESALKGL